jgi:hypothetical protein
MPRVLTKPVVELRGERRPLVIVQRCEAALEAIGFSEESLARFLREVNQVQTCRDILEVCERFCDLRD